MVMDKWLFEHAKNLRKAFWRNIELTFCTMLISLMNELKNKTCMSMNFVHECIMRVEQRPIELQYEYIRYCSSVQL